MRWVQLTLRIGITMAIINQRSLSRNGVSVWDGHQMSDDHIVQEAQEKGKRKTVLPMSVSAWCFCHLWPCKTDAWGNGLGNAFVRRCACPLGMCVALTRKRKEKRKRRGRKGRQGTKTVRPAARPASLTECYQVYPRQSSLFSNPDHDSH